jgi:hypothetical protein
MTDLTPAQAEAVRRALADARHTGPVPPEVADRLAATLDDLVAERGAPLAAAAFAAPAEVAASDADPAAEASGSTNVVPLWRRRLPAVLAAAAAVTAFAVVAPQFVGGDDAGEPASTLAEDGRESATSSDEAGALSGLPPAPDAEDAVPYAADQSLRSTYDVPVLRLHDATIEQELAFLLHPTAASAQGGAPWAADDPDSLDPLGPAGRSTLDSQAKTTTACGPAEPVPGSTTYAARYHRHPALAVVLPAASDVIEVEIYDCAAADPRVPARTVRLDAGE